MGLNSCRPSQTCRRKPPSDTHPRRHVIGGGENRRPAEALRVSGSTGGDGCIRHTVSDGAGNTTRRIRPGYFIRSNRSNISGPDPIGSNPSPNEKAPGLATHRVVMDHVLHRCFLRLLLSSSQNLAPRKYTNGEAFTILPFIYLFICFFILTHPKCAIFIFFYFVWVGGFQSRSELKRLASGEQNK